MDHQRRLVVAAVLLAVVAVGAFAAPGLAPGEDGPSAPPSADAANATQAGNASTGATPAVTVADLVEPCAADPPAEFADPTGNESVIGWVDGVWYDEPLDFEVGGGVNETELERLSARALARVEAIRCLDATEGVPEVTVQTREEFREDRSSGDGSARQRQFENARLATLLLVGQDRDAVEEQVETESSSVAAFYTPALDEITLLTNATEHIQFDEATLAHELGHALQDQQFDFSAFDAQTSDGNRGELALTEGDVTLIEQRYREGCQADAWVQSCLGLSAPDDGSTASGGDETGGEGNPEDGAATAGPRNWGLYFMQFQPYSDGPAFVEALYQRGGWAAVDERYDDPPDSALPVVRPGLPDVSLQNVTVTDHSSGDWRRLTRTGQPTSDRVGVVGISAMFLTPSFETDFEENIYRPRNALNTDPDGDVDRSNPVNYWHPETEGWRGDRLYGYTDGEGGRATVWKLSWANAADGKQFVDAYTELIEYRGGEQAEGRERTYTFGPDSAFDMAVSIRTAGDTVTVVTAPTVEALSSVHDP